MASVGKSVDSFLSNDFHHLHTFASGNSVFALREGRRVFDESDGTGRYAG